MENIKILEYAKKKNGGKQAWIGINPQFDMDIVIIEDCTNYRLSPKFHGVYDTVWLFEKPLNEYDVLQWKILLDEAIRLLKETGKLVIRLAEIKEMRISDVKSFLEKNINIDVSIDYEYKKDRLNTIVFNIKRLNFEIYKDKSWTFAMLTGGKKDDVVIKFLESIRNNELNKSQIIIFGPQKEIYDKYDVEYFDLKDILKTAQGANILVLQDRYYLDNKFFKDFDKYGYDFDFLDLSLPNCMVIKTKTLLKTGIKQFNDIESAKEFISKMQILRVNFLSKIIDESNDDINLSLQEKAVFGKMLQSVKNLIKKGN